jgi:hypothetical protein
MPPTVLLLRSHTSNQPNGWYGAANSDTCVCTYDARHGQCRHACSVCNKPVVALATASPCAGCRGPPPLVMHAGPLFLSSSRNKTHLDPASCGRGMSAVGSCGAGQQRGRESGKGMNIMQRAVGRQAGSTKATIIANFSNAACSMSGYTRAHGLQSTPDAQARKGPKRRSGVR